MKKRKERQIAAACLYGGSRRVKMLPWREGSLIVVGDAMVADERQKLLRMIPAVDSLVGDEGLSARSGVVGREVVVNALRDAMDAAREAITAGRIDGADAGRLREIVLADAASRLDAAARPHYRRAVNATGIILHTGLGRAVLPERALARIGRELGGYSVLQLDLEHGERSKRDGRIEELLMALTGAEAATLVNNNAAATLLVLNTIGAGKEIIVSRGQLVEIGGAFRLPDVMAASGAKMVEVGTTNRTHPHDYENAVTEETAAILRVHPSNYRIEGFSSEVPLDALVKIAHDAGLPLIDDVGAGALLDFSRFGFAKEPTLPESVAAGADIITSSADKLIGASQGGVILGRKELVERVRKNPLWRAMRVGKLTLSAAEATLSLFLDEKLATSEIPTIRMVMRGVDSIAREARRIARAIEKTGVAAEVSLVKGFSQMGSGSLPGQNLPTRLVAVKPTAISVEELGVRLRKGEPPVFTRIRDDMLLVDPRTLLPGDAKIVAEAVGAALSTEATA